MDASASKLVSKMIQLSFGHLNVPTQKNLADLVMAFFYNKSFTLWEIASCLSGETSVKHKHKRLIYFLDKFEFNKSFWQSVILLIFSLPGIRLKSRKYITLALDATTLKDDFWMLAVSVSFQGRSIPIYLKSWQGVNVSYNYWQRVQNVLTELKELLPSKYQYELVADRGFQGREMLKILHTIEWDYVVRVNGSWRMKESDGREFVQLDLFSDGWYENVTLGKHAQLSGVNVSVSSCNNEENKVSKWFLMTNLSTREHAIESYSCRFWIEESFKDLKSKLKWEQYTKKVPTKDRLTKCIMISCLSYAIQTSLGTQIKLSESERKKTSVFNSFRQSFKRSSKMLEAIITKFRTIINSYIRRTKLVIS